MIYEEVDPKLLNFLDNPLDNMGVLLFSRENLRWHTKIFYKVPALRRFISPDQAQWLLAEKLKTGLVEAKEALARHTPREKIPIDAAAIQRFMYLLSRYFQIGVTLVDSEVSSDERRKTIDHFIQINMLGKLEYTCNRAAENLGVYAEENLSLVNNPNLWLCYYLSEVYFLLAHGLLTAKFKGRALHVMPAPKFQRRLKSYWLAEIFESQSKINDTAFLLGMANSLRKQGRLHPSLREQLINYCLDKCLSIHADYLSVDMAHHPQYRYLREIVYFAMHIELRAMLGERVTSEAELRSCMGSATIDLINSALLGRAPTLSSASSFIQYMGKTYVRGPLDFKYGLRKFVKHLLNGVIHADGDKDFRQVLGIGFERDYIINYIRRFNDSRFKVYDEFKPGNHAQIKGYDIDLIIQDLEDDIYYFIQVKYLHSDLPTYLSEQYRLFHNENFRKGFDRQLAVLRDNLADESIRKKLSSHGLAGAHTHNSYFVLLHNIPFLNFYELDGIFFYEWNLLRNILQDGRVHVRKDEVLAEGNFLGKPRLHRPEEMVDAYLKHSKSSPQLADHYDIYSRASALFIYDDMEVVCKLI